LLSTSYNHFAPSPNKYQLVAGFAPSLVYTLHQLA